MKLKSAIRYLVFAIACTFLFSGRSATNNAAGVWAPVAELAVNAQRAQQADAEKQPATKLELRLLEIDLHTLQNEILILRERVRQLEAQLATNAAPVSLRDRLFEMERTNAVTRTNRLALRN